METNALDYTLVAILLVIMEEKEVHPVTFHFYMFKATELSYDTYNKELFTVFKAFCT